MWYEIEIKIRKIKLNEKSSDVERRWRIYRQPRSFATNLGLYRFVISFLRGDFRTIINLLLAKWICVKRVADKIETEERQKNEEKEIQYTVGERIAPESPRQIRACCNFPGRLDASVEKKCHPLLSCQFLLVRESIQFQKMTVIVQSQAERIIKLFRTGLIDFGETGKLTN